MKIYPHTAEKMFPLAILSLIYWKILIMLRKWASLVSERQR